MASGPIRDPKTDDLLTPQNSALVVIDYQPLQVNSIASVDRNLLVNHIVVVAKTGVGFRLPIVRKIKVAIADVIRSEISLEVIDFNVRFLRRVAKALKVPIVLSSVGCRDRQGSSHARVDYEREPVLDRQRMNGWDNPAFRLRMEATGRKLYRCGALDGDLPRLPGRLQRLLRSDPLHRRIQQRPLCLAPHRVEP